MSEIRVPAAATATVPGVDSGDMFMLSISRNVIFTVSSHWIILNEHILRIYFRKQETVNWHLLVTMWLHAYISSVCVRWDARGCEDARTVPSRRTGGRGLEGGWRPNLPTLNGTLSVRTLAHHLLWTDPVSVSLLSFYFIYYVLWSMLMWVKSN